MVTDPYNEIVFVNELSRLSENVILLFRDYIANTVDNSSCCQHGVYCLREQYRNLQLSIFLYTSTRMKTYTFL